MSDERRIDEAELHAFADGRLDPERLGAVEAYLEAHPEEARRIEDFHVLNRGMRTIYDGVLSEPVPARLQRRPQARTSSRWRILWPAMALAAGLLLGWFGRDVVGAPGAMTASLALDAIAAHQLYAPDPDHPLEVSASQQGRVLTWLQYRLGEDVAPPDLTKFGYELQGARAMASFGGLAVQLTYRDRQGDRMTLLIARVDPAQREVSVRRRVDDGLATIFWIDDGFACAMVGAADAANLPAAAESAYRQLTNA